MPERLSLTETRVFWDGKEVGLTFKQVRVVRHLFERRGTHVTLRTIYIEYRGSQILIEEDELRFRVNTRAVIRRIRRKFRALDGNFAEIECKAGMGYRWRSSEPT